VIKILCISLLFIVQSSIISNPEKPGVTYIKNWKITTGNDGKLEFNITTGGREATQDDLIQITNVKVIGLLNGEGSSKIKGTINMTGVFDKILSNLCNNLQYCEKKMLIFAGITGVTWLGCYCATKVMVLQKDESRICEISRDAINYVRKSARFCTHILLFFAGVSYFLRKKVLPNLNNSLTKIFLESLMT